MLFECSYCKALVDGHLQSAISRFDPEDDTSEFRVSLLKCCQNALLAGQYLQNPDEGFEAQDWGRAWRLWPSPSRNLSSAVPLVARRSLEDAKQLLFVLSGEVWRGRDAGEGTAGGVEGPRREGEPTAVRLVRAGRLPRL